MWAPRCSDSIPPVYGLFLFLPLSSLLSRHPEMPCWQDDTCKLFCSLLTCRGPWPSSQTHSKALKVKWKIPLLFVVLGDPSSQPGYSSYPNGGLLLHWSRGRIAKWITGQGMYTLIPSVSLSVLTWLHQGVVPSSLSLSGVWFYPCRPCRSSSLSFLLS